MLVCHPRLVQTGLDLGEFPTNCWYETGYSVSTVRQASRRSWRIGQTEPVQVVFMADRGTTPSGVDPVHPFVIGLGPYPPPSRRGGGFDEWRRQGRRLRHR